MTRYRLRTLLIVLATGLCALLPANAAEPTLLNGQWRIVRYDVGNTKRLVEWSRRGSVSFAAGKMRVVAADQDHEVEYDLVIEGTGDINMFSLKRKPPLEREFFGIARLNKARLELCFGDMRPAVFEANPLADFPRETDTVHLIILEKEKGP